LFVLIIGWTYSSSNQLDKEVTVLFDYVKTKKAMVIKPWP